MKKGWGKSVEIPVKYVAGRWELLYGGPLPMKEGAYGEIKVHLGSVLSATLAELLQQETDLKILNEGAELLVALTIKPNQSLAPGLQNHIRQYSQISDKLSQEYHHFIRSGDTHFVPVSIGPPTPTQRFLNPDGQGGAWIRVKGMKPLAIDTSYINVPEPVSKEPLESLNHAFTRLSECYEPWRKSHTGSIYERVLYKDSDGLWYPLDALRDTVIARDEKRLIKRNWMKFMESIGFKFAEHSGRSKK